MRLFKIAPDFSLKIAPKPLSLLPSVESASDCLSPFMIHTCKESFALGTFVPDRYLKAYRQDEGFADRFPFVPITLLCYQQQITICRQDQMGQCLDICSLLERSLGIPVNAYWFEQLHYCPERRGWYLSVGL